jgi:hypothetical protein
MVSSAPRRVRRCAIAALVAIALTAAGGAVATPSYAAEPVAVTAAPTGLDAFAGARDVRAYLTTLRDGLLPAESSEQGTRQLNGVARFLATIADGDGGLPPGTVEQLLEDAGAVGAYFEQTVALDPLDRVGRALPTLVEAAERLVDAIRVVVFQAVHLDRLDQAVALATAVVDELRGGDPSTDVLGDLSAIALAVVDRPEARPVLDQVDTVLLYAGSQSRPYTDAVPPTSEAAFAAAEAVAGWFAALGDTVAAYDPDPHVGEADAGVEAGPGVTVAGPDPQLWLDTPVDSTVDSLTGLAAEQTGASKCYAPDRICTPPMRNPTNNPVQHNPTLYLVFWGPGWNDSTTTLPAERAAVTHFAGGLGGSLFQALLDQYYDATGHVGTDVTVASWTDPTSLADVPRSDSGLLLEATKAHDRNGWRSGPNVQYLIFPDNGRYHFGADSCGHHTHGLRGTVRYVFGVVEYPEGDCAGSGTGTVASALTVVASHEYAEAVTDPLVNFRSAWTDGHWEIADMCQMTTDFGSVGGYPVTQLWSNAANSCAMTFEHGRRFQVFSPPTSPQGPLTRGHAYAGATVVLRNIGSTAWYTTGTHRIRLVPQGGACSHFYAPSASKTAPIWRSCRGVEIPVAHTVGPGDLLTFTFPLRPDGALTEGSTVFQTFDVNLLGIANVAPGVPGDYPRVGDPIATHGAAVNAMTHEVPGVGVPVTVVAGSDVTVNLYLDVTRTASWYGDEVVDLATLPLDDPSPWAAGNWPKPPGVRCTRCRAGRVMGGEYKPGTTYLFPVTLHVPANTLPGPQQVEFRPVADIPLAEGGIAEAPFGPVVTVLLVVIGPQPLAHEVAGTTVDGPMYDPAVTFAAAARPTSRWWGCVAVAGVGAVGTTVTACTATVKHADGSVGRSATVTSGKETLGPVAKAVGTGLQLDHADDTVRVCWTASARFASPVTPVVRSGCSTG